MPKSVEIVYIIEPLEDRIYLLNPQSITENLLIFHLNGF